MPVTLIQPTFNLENIHLRTPAPAAPHVQAQPNAPQSAASAGTRVHGLPQASFRRKLLKSASQNKDVSIKKIAKDAWRANAENLIRQRTNGHPLSYGDEAFAKAVNAAMLGVPALRQNETLAMAVVEQLYSRGTIPVKLKDLISATNQLSTEFETETEAAKRRNATMSAAGGSRPSSPSRRDSESGSTRDAPLPQYPHPSFDPPSYSGSATAEENRWSTDSGSRPIVSGRQLRSWHLQSDFSSLSTEELAQVAPFIGIDDDPENGRRPAGGAPVPSRMNAGDYSALSDAELDELAPYLFQDDDVSQNRAGHAVPPKGVSAGDYSTLPDDELMTLLQFIDDNPANDVRRPQVPDTAVLRATLTDAQREEAESLIPLAIRYPHLLGRAVQYDEVQQAEVVEKWRNAMELLVYYRNNPAHVPSEEEAALILQRQQAPKPLVGTLDENFDWNQVTLRDTPGGGDCLVHALEEGRTMQQQSPAQILLKRQEIAGMRSANPHDPGGNRYALVSSLDDVDPQFQEHLRWEGVVPEGGVSNHLLAAFQACPGMYSGTDMVVQWTMLEHNRDKTVITIDSGHTIDLDPANLESRVQIQSDVMAYRNGQRIPFEGPLTNARLNDLLAQGHIVIRNKEQHWQSLCPPVERHTGTPTID